LRWDCRAENLELIPEDQQFRSFKSTQVTPEMAVEMQLSSRQLPKYMAVARDRTTTYFNVSVPGRKQKPSSKSKQVSLRAKYDELVAFLVDIFGEETFASELHDRYIRLVESALRLRDTSAPAGDEES
jgi:hypothetical protein